MAKEPNTDTTKLSKALIDGLEPKSSRYFKWDSGDRAIKGFGVCVFPSGQISYYFQYRNAYRQTRRILLGKHGDITLYQARNRAEEKRNEVANGLDPMGEKSRKAKAITVSNLLDEYLVSEKFAQKAKNTRDVDVGRIERHLKPLLGSTILETLTTEDVRKAFAGIRDGKTAANVKTGFRGRAIVTGGEGAARMAIRLLRAVINWHIQERKLQIVNPASGIDLGRDGERKTPLESAAEYTLLFEALQKLQERRQINPKVADCIRVLALTGARRNEIAAMRWSWVNLKAGIITVPAKQHKSGKKTGDKEISLPSAAQAIIASQPTGQLEDYVFPPAHGKGPISLSKKIWAKIRSETGLPTSLTNHSLRHSLGTMMGINGAEGPQIMMALGHKQISTTTRYIKAIRNAKGIIIERHTAGISASLNGVQPGVVLPFSSGTKAGNRDK